MSFIHFNETFWVGIAFFMFVGLLWKFKIFNFVGSSLDNRAEKIKEELDEARKLKEEAQALLASYQRKHRKASEEAEDIVKHATKEADLLVKEAKKRLEEEIEKRTNIAEEKISQAEAAALQQIRDNAVDITINAARSLIVEHLDDADSGQLLEAAIDDMGRKFH